MGAMKTYLNLFEQTIREQAKRVGQEVAFSQAKKAGLEVSEDGHIVSYTGHPHVVLLRLIQFFSEDDGQVALESCALLIKELLRQCTSDEESKETSAKQNDDCFSSVST